MPSRILQLASSLDTGGAERVIAHLTRHLDRRRFVVWPCHLFSPSGAIGEELTRDGYEVIDVRRDPRGIRRYLSFRLVRRIVRERAIDLIHTHTHYALGDAALCALTTGFGVKVVHTFHYGNYPHMPAHYLALEGVAARAANALVAVGSEQAARVRQTFRLPEQRVHVVRNGVDVAVPEPDPEWARRLAATGAVVVGTICTFIEQKGLPELLEAAAEVRRSGTKVVFVIVGDGVLRQWAEARCRELDLDQVVFFTGWKPRAHITMMPLFDIFFQPSRWEAMSMVILEAMAAGRPVVATDVGDNRHVIEHGISGLIVAPRSAPAMAAALNTLIASPSMRQQFGAAGRRRHGERHLIADMVRQYEQLYEQVLQGTSHRALVHQESA